MQKIFFPHICTKKDSKIGNVFLKFCHLDFLKTIWKENYCDTWLLNLNSMPVKPYVLESLPKVLTNDHIAGFQKVQYFKMNWDMNGQEGPQNKAYFVFFQNFVTWYPWVKIAWKEKHCDTWLPIPSSAFD